MNREDEWRMVWQELRGNLLKQPPCPQHRQYPCVTTLTQRVTNDVVRVDDGGVTIRSHRTSDDDFIGQRVSRTWWKHLVVNGSASLVPGAPSNPDSDRSRIVGAIMVTCLPGRTSVADSRTIRLASKPTAEGRIVRSNRDAFRPTPK